MNLAKKGESILNNLQNSENPSQKIWPKSGQIWSRFGRDSMNSNGATTSAASGGGADGAAAARRQSKRPKYSRFTQQELPACKPLLTPGWVISAFMIVGVIFIPIGVISLVASNRVVEIVDRYEIACVPPAYNASRDLRVKFIKSSNESKACNRTLMVPKDMKAPIYVYYQLDNFYQNHRRYVKSRNDQQLRKKGSANETDSCKPEATTGNGLPIVPCGLIAWSLFNDTYSFSRSGTPLTVNKKHISWKSDRNHKFGKHVFPQNFQNGTLIGGGKLDPNKSLSEQEDLIVWMRTAALPTFRKLYGKIEVDLNANDIIEVNLANNYNTYSFSGKKKLVLSTTSFLGGKNNFLGIAYLTVGGLCFFLAMVFFLVHIIKPRPLGDPAYLSWNRNPPEGRTG